MQAEPNKNSGGFFWGQSGATVASDGKEGSSAGQAASFVANNPFSAPSVPAPAAAAKEEESAAPFGHVHFGVRTPEAASAERIRVEDSDSPFSPMSDQPPPPKEWDTGVPHETHSDSSVDLDAAWSDEDKDEYMNELRRTFTQRNPFLDGPDNLDGTGEAPTPLGGAGLSGLNFTTFVPLGSSESAQMGAAAAAAPSGMLWGAVGRQAAAASAAAPVQRRKATIPRPRKQGAGQGSTKAHKAPLHSTPAASVPSTPRMAVNAASIGGVSPEDRPGTSTPFAPPSMSGAMFGTPAGEPLFGRVSPSATSRLNAAGGGLFSSMASIAGGAEAASVPSEDDPAHAADLPFGAFPAMFTATSRSFAADVDTGVDSADSDSAVASGATSRSTSPPPQGKASSPRATSQGSKSRSGVRRPGSAVNVYASVSSPQAQRNADAFGEVAQLQTLKDGARDAYKDGRFAEAEHKYASLCTRVPGDAKHWCNRAASRVMLAQYAPALHDALRATALDRRYVRAHLRAATALCYMGQLWDARSYLRWAFRCATDAALEARSARPDWEVAMEKAGMGRGSTDPDVVMMRDIAALRRRIRDHEAAISDAATALRGGEGKVALQCISKATASSDMWSPVAVAVQAQALLMLRRPNEALAVCLAAMPVCLGGSCASTSLRQEVCRDFKHEVDQAEVNGDQQWLPRMRATPSAQILSEAVTPEECSLAVLAARCAWCCDDEPAAARLLASINPAAHGEHPWAVWASRLMDRVATVKAAGNREFKFGDLDSADEQYEDAMEQLSKGVSEAGVLLRALNFGCGGFSHRAFSSTAERFVQSQGGYACLEDLQYDSDDGDYDAEEALSGRLMCHHASIARAAGVESIKAKYAQKGGSHGEFTLVHRQRHMVDAVSSVQAYSRALGNGEGIESTLHSVAQFLRDTRDAAPVELLPTCLVRSMTGVSTLPGLWAVSTARASFTWCPVLLAHLWANVAAVAMRRDDWYGAIDACKRAMTHEPHHVRAASRAARAHVEAARAAATKAALDTQRRWLSAASKPFDDSGYLSAVQQLQSLILLLKRVGRVGDPGVAPPAESTTVDAGAVRAYALGQAASVKVLLEETRAEMASIQQECSSARSLHNEHMRQAAARAREAEARRAEEEATRARRAREKQAQENFKRWSEKQRTGRRQKAGAAQDDFGWGGGQPGQGAWGGAGGYTAHGASSAPGAQRDSSQDGRKARGRQYRKEQYGSDGRSGEPAGSGGQHWAGAGGGPWGDAPGGGRQRRAGRRAGASSNRYKGSGSDGSSGSGGGGGWTGGAGGGVRDANAAHYSLLSVAGTATTAEVKKAYRKLILKHHPDKMASKSAVDQEAATAKTKQLNAAVDAILKARGE